MVGAADGSDGPPPLHELTCNSWENANPTLVMKLYPPEGGMSGGGGGSSMPFNNVTVEHLSTSNGEARLMISTNTPGSGLAIATVGESGGAETVITSNMGVYSIYKTSTDIEFLASDDSASGTWGYYAVEDSDPGTSPTSIIGPAAMNGGPPAFGGTMMTDDINAQFLPLSPSGYYTLASYSNGTQYQAAAWLPSAAQWNVVISPSSQGLQLNSPLVQDGTNVYGFYPPPGSTGGGGPGPLDQYTFPTNSDLGPASRNILSNANEAALTLAVGTASDGSFQLAFVDLPTAQSAVVKLGDVPQSQIDTFLVDDLASLQFNVQSDGGIFDTTPFGGRGNPARWLSNGDLGVLGTGGTGGSTTSTGLNFYVGTPDGQWLVETAGSGSNILAGQTILASGFDLSQAVTSILLKFDLAWVVQEADGGYALYFNVLSCQP